ncbi:MAG TPA: tetraacyldisaccharide 4'-kinase [Steroidobacteraceae bacterium]|nr:tetraacyldisaccharide 4'-kinase [Steroidobacteraceae bacterium]
MNLRRWLESAWYSGRAPLLLRPLSALYGLALLLRSALYRSGVLPSGHPGVPVIVVGNLTVGGTGKTPLVLWLARQLQLQGRQVGIISRGYGGAHAGRRGAARLVRPDDEAAEVGDEPLLLARATRSPVAIGVRRLDAARLLAAQGCQVLVADDGLQHLALKRDIGIAVIDAARPFGNGSLLPAGPLREPASRLADIDAVVVHGDAAALPPGDQPRFRMHLQAEQLVALALGDVTDPRGWQGRRVHAVAGIGNPQRFFAALRKLGMEPIEHPFPDHHRYQAADLAFGDALDIVMTAKDAVKCAAFAAQGMWYLEVAVRFERDDAERLMQWLGGRLARKS